MQRKSSLQKSVGLALAGWLLSGSFPAQNVQAIEPRAPTTVARESDTNALTLEKAIAVALANNPDLRVGTARVEAAYGRADQARLWSNPELSLGTEDIPVNGGTFRDSKNTIGVAQTVPYPGKKKLDARIGGMEVRLREAEWTLRRLALVRDVKASFFRVLAAEGLVNAGRDLVQVAASSSSAARKRVEAGAAADQEQLRAEIQLDQARAELASFERELATSRRELITLLGRGDLGGARVVGALTETPDSSLLAHGPAQWVALHPSVIAARAVRSRTELELRRARLEPYPDVTLGVSGGREGPDHNAIVEFKVSLPVPIIDRAKGRKREAQANVDAADAEVAAAEQMLIRDWDIASSRFRAAAEQVATYRDRIIPKASQALKLVQTGFQEGKFGFLDLLDTQRTAAEARLAYQQKLLELNIAQADLQALFTLPTAAPGSAQPDHLSPSKGSQP